MPDCVLNDVQAREVLRYLCERRGYSVRQLAQLLGIHAPTLKESVPALAKWHMYKTVTVW